MQLVNSGWRDSAFIDDTPHPIHTDEKSDLFEAARLCSAALGLSASARFVLDQLCAAYGGKLVEGRMIVWPSNAYLEARTGICERSVRYCLKKLLELGVIQAKDSPNGKRYARRDARGQVICAFGFDLGPILSRLGEWKDAAERRAEEKARRRMAFDEITIARRNTLELAGELLSHADITEANNRVSDVMRNTPRRNSKADPSVAVKLWKDLYEWVKSKTLAAKGGNICRHKDTKQYPLKKTCSKGNRASKEEALRPHIKDATEILGDFSDHREMLERANKFRGMLGVSEDAWIEARREIGDECTAKLFYLVAQIQCRPSPGADQIRNFGGYFRVLTRKVKSGEFSVHDEILRRGRGQ